MKHDTISRMQRRGQAYWYEDGLWELVLGVLFVFYALYYAAVGLLPEESTVGTVMNVGYIFVVPGGMFIAARIVHRLKARVTSPRTGYVAFRRSTRSRIRSVVIAVLVTTVVALGAVFVETIYVPVLAGGVGLAIGLGITGYRVGLPRMMVSGAIALVSAFGLSLTTDNPEIAFSLLFGVVGIATAVAGGLTVRKFVRANPIESEGADDE